MCLLENLIAPGRTTSVLQRVTFPIELPGFFQVAEASISLVIIAIIKSSNANPGIQAGKTTTDKRSKFNTTSGGY